MMYSFQSHEKGMADFLPVKQQRPLVYINARAFKGLCECADMKVQKQSALLSSVWVCLLDAVIAGLSGTVNRVQAFWALT